MKVKITYPQIVFHSQEIEMTEEEFEDLKNKSLQEKTDFIFNKLSQHEQDWMPYGKKGLKNTLELEYATIKAVK